MNVTNWDARADAHNGPGGYRLHLVDPTWISSVVRFERPRLGDVRGLDCLHLQCHLGTDTVSLSRLGARMTGLDLSSRSLQHARALAERAGEQVDYVQADVYSAPEALGGRTFDLVYTAIGALCWLPDIRLWGQTMARLLRPAAASSSGTPTRYSIRSWGSSCVTTIPTVTSSRASQRQGPPRPRSNCRTGKTRQA